LARIRGEDGSGARHGALEPSEPLDERLVLPPTRRIHADEHAFAPVGLEPLEKPLVFVADHVDRRIASVEHEPRNALGMLGGQHQ
jgi:hypothetical protein